LLKPNTHDPEEESKIFFCLRSMLSPILNLRDPKHVESGNGENEGIIKTKKGMRRNSVRMK